MDILRLPAADLPRHRLHAVTEAGRPVQISLPRDQSLGWHAGHLHWSVRFDAGALIVPLDAPAESYLARLGELAAPGRLDVQIVDHAT